MHRGGRNISWMGGAHTGDAVDQGGRGRGGLAVLVDPHAALGARQRRPAPRELLATPLQHRDDGWEGLREAEGLKKECLGPVCVSQRTQDKRVQDVMLDRFYLG